MSKQELSSLIANYVETQKLKDPKIHSEIEINSQQT